MDLYKIERLNFYLQTLKAFSEVSQYQDVKQAHDYLYDRLNVIVSTLSLGCDKHIFGTQLFNDIDKCHTAYALDRTIAYYTHMIETLLVHDQNVQKRRPIPHYQNNTKTFEKIAGWWI